jgi:3-oxoadipate enol-lactonase
MPYIRSNGTDLWCEDTGGSLAPILFSHGLLFSSRLFDAQVEALREQYRCVAYDHRGQGRSAPSTMRSIDMDTLTADAIALIEALEIAPVHFCGLSMGGFVGMRLAARGYFSFEERVLASDHLKRKVPAFLHGIWP